jgi:thiamine pyrophosphate-dependent acetolactate synthase large subunit-like protein
MQERQVPVYEALAHDIKRFGATQVFGLMSDDTALFAATLDAMGVAMRGARHENEGVAMADGYSSATGKVAIAVVGRGPALANALHGTMFSSRSGARVLLIVGDSANRPTDPNAFGPEQKAFAASAVLQAAGLRTYVASTAVAARRVLREALTAAHGGLAVLLLPVNVQRELVDLAGTDPGPVAVPAVDHGAGRPGALDAARALLSRARRPLIIGGLGAFQAGATEAIVALADRLGAALATTLKAQDMFRGHPFNCGIIGSFSHAAGRRLMEQADCILVFGASLNQRTTSFGHALPPDAPIIHVDVVRSGPNRWFPADVAITGDARAVAQALCESLPARDAAEMPLRSAQAAAVLSGFDPASAFEAAHTQRTVDPRSLAIALDKLLPAQRNVVWDAGNFFQVVPYVSVPGPSHVKHSVDFGSIGLGFGTALGFAVGAPDVPTVLFIGDGGLLMTLGELETTVREDIPLVIVLMNDCAYGAELHCLKEQDMPVSTSKFPDIDFAPIAEAFGFSCATIRSMKDLEAVAPLLARPEGPVFLDCKINGAIAAPFVLENVEQEKKRR